MREAHAAERKTLFVVGSYHIGKERAFFGAAKAMGFKIWCHAAKKRVSTDIDNSFAIHCSCTGQSAVSLASCMLLQLSRGSKYISAKAKLFAPNDSNVWPVMICFGWK